MDRELERVGWIGTGRMGSAMVERLLADGGRVTVWNRTRARADALAGRGATVAGQLSELAGLDVVFTTMTADEALLSVTLGEGGVLGGAEAPRYLVDSSTVSEGTSRRLREEAAKRGTVVLAAPVSGNPKVVRAGRLSIAVSGPREAYEAVAPLLRRIGPTVAYVGEGDEARLVKLAHNVLLGVLTQSLSEVTVLAERAGVPRAAFLDFLNGSVLGSAFTRYKSPALVNLDLTPTFTTTLLRKDFDLGLAAARELRVPMPLAAAAHELVQDAIGRGHGEEDFAALLVEQARRSGLVPEPENVPVDDGLS